MMRIWSGQRFGRESANLSWMLADRSLRMAVGFLVSMFVARHLGPDGFGRLSYALSCLALVGFLIPLGLNNIAKREMIVSPENVRPVLATIVGMRAVALILTLAIGAGVVLVLPTKDRLMLVAAAGMLLVPFVTSFDLVLEARLLGKTTFAARLIPTFGSAALRVVLLIFDAPAEAFAFAVSAEAVLLALTLAWTMRRLGVEYPLKRFEPRLAKRFFAESWPLILSGLAVTIYGRIDLVMLRYFTEEAIVGQYAAAVRLSEISYLVPTLLASTFYPALIAAQQQNMAFFRRRVQQFLDLNAMLAFLSAAVLCGGAAWWIALAYGPAFAPARSILAVHAWSALFVYLGVARSHILTAERKTMIQLISTGVGALTNVALNAWLIPRSGAVGAACATIAAQAAAAWLVLAMSSESRWVFHQITISVLFPITGLRYLRPKLDGRNQ